MKLKTSAKLIARKIVPLIEVADEELVEYFLETKNQEAFEMIYNRYRARVYNFILSLSKDSAVSEELTHDCFLKLYRKMDLYIEGRKFSSWLWTLVRHTVYDHFRKKDAMNYTSELGDDVSVEELYIHEDSPEKLILRKADIEDVRDCFSELNMYQKEVLSLRMYSDLSYQEIKDCMESTVASIKSTLNRAKKVLTRCLEGKRNG